MYLIQKTKNAKNGKACLDQGFEIIGKTHMQGSQLNVHFKLCQQDVLNCYSYNLLNPLKTR
jgi:hypothetical protein